MDASAFPSRIAADRAILNGEPSVVIIHTAAGVGRIATDRAVHDREAGKVQGSPSPPLRSVAFDGDAGERGVAVVEYAAAAVAAEIRVAAGNRQTADADRARCDLQRPRRAARVDLELIRTRARDGEISVDRKLAQREIDRAGD